SIHDLSLLLNTDIYLFSSGCTIYENFETKTVGVGDDVTLTCPRDASWYSTQLFWFRLVSGDLPEVLGGTFTKQKPGTFVMIIDKAKVGDTGLYFCVKQEGIKMTVLKGTFLQIKEPSITSVVQDISQDPVHPGDLMTLQCSVLSESENNTCPGKHRVFWFRAGSDENHPSVIYTHGNRPGGCEESPEAHSPQKCVYSFSKTVNSSDASTYFCAVAACGEILFGNGTKIDIKGNCTAFNMNHFLTFIFKQLNLPGRFYAEDSLVYSAPTFSKIRTDKREKRKVKAATEETIYTGVRTPPTG
uniref:Ig-like domain-containing protein n=1 Tax=Labrus bergylta TaxID=56723 RepID=A0A3Q3F8G0_9LABR